MDRVLFAARDARKALEALEAFDELSAFLLFFSACRERRRCIVLN
jgi:hypothetical protein